MKKIKNRKEIDIYDHTLPLEVCVQVQLGLSSALGSESTSEVATPCVLGNLCELHPVRPRASPNAVTTPSTSAPVKTDGAQLCRESFKCQGRWQGGVPTGFSSRALCERTTYPAQDIKRQL